MRILIVGDSQAAGAPGEALQRALTAEGYDVVRVAKVGKGLVSWRADGSLVAALEEVDPDTLLGLFGSNNPPGPALMSAAQWFAALGGVYSGPPAYSDPSRRELGERIRAQLAPALGAAYLDVWTATDRPAYYQPDGIHLRPDGGDAWAVAVLARLDRRPFPLLAVLGIGALGIGAAYLAARTFGKR